MPFLAPSAEALGPFSSFLASCTWALGATVYASLSARYSGPAVNFSRALVAFPLFCVALYLFHQGQGTLLQEFLALPLTRWGWFLASVMGSFALGDTLFLLSARSLGVPSALAISSIYPIWSALAGWVFLGNPFDPAKGLGVFLVVGGTVVVILHGRRRQ
ncbi:MAG: DMT family transporter, partial [Bdellovibrionota bacterium]